MYHVLPEVYCGQRVNGPVWSLKSLSVTTDFCAYECVLTIHIPLSPALSDPRLDFQGVLHFKHHENKSQRMRDLYGSIFIAEFRCSRMIYFWIRKNVRNLEHRQKQLLIKGCLSFYESHVMDEIYELESVSKDLQCTKLVMTSSRRCA